MERNFIKFVKIKIPEFISHIAGRDCSVRNDQDWMFNYDRLIVNHQPLGNQMWTRMSHWERIKLNQESIKEDNYNVTIQSHHRKSNTSNHLSERFSLTAADSIFQTSLQT